MLLSVPASFVETQDPLQGHNVWVEAFNRRQAVKQEHESMSRTAMQIAVEIDQFKTMCESLPSCKSKLQPAQLVQELHTLGLLSVQGGRKEDDSDGKITVNLVTQALAVKKGILSSARAVELLLELEQLYGTRSPFHQMSRLHVLSTKPSTNQMRDWVLESLHDGLAYDVLQIGEISKGSLSGDKHHTGLVGLFEMKKKAGSTEYGALFSCIFPIVIMFPCFCQVLNHFFEVLLPKSGMAEGDRALLKEKLSAHEVYRQHSGDGDCTWMARLKKSGIDCFHLLEDRFFCLQWSRAFFNHFKHDIAI